MDGTESSRARALALVEQGRFDLAEPHVREVLSDDPDDTWAHAIMALCISSRKQHNDAIMQAERAVKAAPNIAFAHYVKSIVLSRAENPQSSLRAIREALKLEPEDADYHAHHASVLLDADEPEPALVAADRALEIDARHVNALNMRAHALMRLGRFDRAQESLKQSLKENPENDSTHSAAGLYHLQTGDAETSVEHFLQSLRIDPNDATAKEGLIEALKARHRIYRVVLMSLMWLGRQSAAVRWSTVIGIVVLRNIFRTLARHNPDLAPLFMPLAIILGVFFLLMWLADPVFNLVLRLHPLGRRLFTSRQLVRQNVLLSLLLGSAIVLLAALTIGNSVLTLPFFLVLAVLPSAGVSLAYSGRRRRFYLALTTLLGTVGVATILLERSVPAWGPIAQLGMVAYIHGCLVLPIWRMLARDEPDALA